MFASHPAHPRLAVVSRNIVLSVLIGVFAVGWTRGASEDLVYPVNMTLSGTRLFVSDRYSGVHMFDVADPTAPAKTLRIPLSGNRGTAVRQDILYANDENKLLVIRLGAESYEVVKEIQLHENAVPFPIDSPIRDHQGFGCRCSSADNAPVMPAAGNATSSYATFTLADDFLYYLDFNSIVTLDISQPDDPKELSRTDIAWTVETLQAAGDLLLVGATDGVYIFDRSDPATPTQVGRLQHARACDPVVVSGNVAFVTLRGGNMCGQNNDVLLCVSIEDPSNPVLIGQKELETPYGLAARDPFLYVSSGRSGFELIDVARPTVPALVAQWQGWPTRDFLWSGDILFVLGFDNLLVFDVSLPDDPVLLAAVGNETS